MALLQCKKGEPPFKRASLLADGETSNTIAKNAQLHTGAWGERGGQKKLQTLAKERLKDAKALLGRKRWSGAYCFSGYVIECGLKSCLLKYLGESDAIFGDDKYLKRLSECWTHDLVKLVGLAGLEATFGAARGANPALAGFWGVVKDWKETSRYELKTEAEARSMFEAVSHKPDGVHQWIVPRW